MGNLCRITLGPVAIILTSLALGQRGPVLILATFFSFAEKLAGTSFGIPGDIWDGVEEIGFTIFRRAGHRFNWDGHRFTQVLLS